MIISSVALVIAVCAPTARAQSFSQNFENVCISGDYNSNCPSLTGAGWVLTNLSNAAGTAGWYQGLTDDPPWFRSQSGSLNSYIAVDFASAGDGLGMDTVSDWLIGPNRTFSNGDTVSFWTRTRTNTTYADRLQLRISLSGASTFIGSSATSVGVFNTQPPLTMSTIDINPTYLTNGAGSYPTVWTNYVYTFGGLGAPTSGRFAFRYFVEDGGTGGTRSNYIGIDSVQYTAALVPEPSALALLVIPALLLRRRRKD